MDNLLCAPCLWALCIPATVVEVDGDPNHRLDVQPGPRMVAAVRAEVDQGRRVTINRYTGAGFYAATAVRGTATCSIHLQEVIYSSRSRGEPW